MRGTWQGSGTFEVTGAGCGPVVAGAAVLVAAAAAVEWLLARIWWVVGGTVLVAAVTGAAVLCLMRWTGRREVEFGRQRQRSTLRAEQLREIGTSVPVPLVIEGGLHIHLHGLDADEQPDVIRQALAAEVQPAVQSRLPRDDIK